MKRTTLMILGALSLVACERRNGNIIIHEDEAKQKTEEAAQKTEEAAKKTGEEAKKLGHDIKQGAEEIGQEVKEKTSSHDAGRGIGGGPTTHCDAGVTCEPSQ